MMHRYFRLLAAGTFLLLVGCTQQSPTPQASDLGSASPSSTASPSSSASTASSTGDGAKVMSCTQELTFKKAPERVVLLGDDSVPFMIDLDKLDTVIGLGEAIPKGVYPPEVEAKLAKVPMLETTNTPGGGAQVSTETLLAANPDLVIGYDSGADRAALNKAGVPLYSADAWCKDIPKKPVTFKSIDDEVRKYATIFHEQEKGEAIIEDLSNKVKQVEGTVKEKRGTGIALYAQLGKSTFSAYGNSSMIQPMFEAVGLDNVYKDNPDRVIRDTSMETIMEKNPGTIILLYQVDDPEQIKKEFMAIQGADQLDAVKNNKVYTLPFVYTDPPTPNSITGVEKLNELLNS